MVRGFNTIAKAAMLAALLIFVGCGTDGTRLTDPDDSGSSEIPETPLSPRGANHRGVPAGDLLRWNAPNNADAARIMGYNVYVFDPDPSVNESYVRFNEALVPAGRFIVSKFSKGSTVWFRVAAVNSVAEEGAWSEPVSFVAVGPDGEDPRGGLEEHDGDGVEPSGPGPLGGHGQP